MLNHNYIGTEHILLGLIHEGEGVAAQVLQRLGADLERVRARVVELVAAYPSAGEVRAPTPPAAPTEEELARHAADLAQIHDLAPEDVEGARRTLDLAPEGAKTALAEFVLFAKQFDLDVVELARFVRERRPEDD